MDMNVKGIHHISLINDHPQEIIDFYAGVLGLRLVKKTLNYDDAKMYHLYFSNDQATLGTLITSFPSSEEVREATIGAGQTTSMTLAIPVGSMSFWHKRLESFQIEVQKTKKFGASYLAFKDQSGVPIEMVETVVGRVNHHEFNGITKEVAIKGIYGIILTSKDSKETKAFVESLGYKKTNEDVFYERFTIEAEFGHTIDIEKGQDVIGKLGIGSIHHVAFNIGDQAIEDYQKQLESFNVTKVKDRKYFKSIYLREKGGAIFEFATENPGILVDESLDDLGNIVQIPEHFKHLEEQIKKTYVPLFVRDIKKLTKYAYRDYESYMLSTAHERDLKRINELAKISKNRTLTDIEKEEQQMLRKQYVKRITSGFRHMVEGVKVIDSDGKEIKFMKKEQ